MASSIYHSGVAVTLDVPRATGRPLKAYFAAPEASGPHPGVVVIHEAYGLNENIRQVADRFADTGYASLAVDLFSTASKPVCRAHDPEAAADSWQRTLAFFDRYLRGAA